MNIEKLAKIREELDCFIKGAENWAPVYKNDPVSFQKLIYARSVLETGVKKYLQTVGPRFIAKVDWDKFAANEVKASDDYLVDVSLTEDDEDLSLFVKLTFEPINAAALAGMLSLQNEVNITPTQTLTSRISDAAANRGSALIKDITKASKDKVNSIIKTSLDKGLTLDETKQRLMDEAFGEQRAETIAITESVRAYSGGRMDYALDTGADGKRQDTNPDACDDCTENQQYCDENGTVGDIFIPMEDDYPNDPPPTHPHCYCSESFHYPDGSTDDSGDDGS